MGCGEGGGRGVSVWVVKAGDKCVCGEEEGGEGGGGAEWVLLVSALSLPPSSLSSL